MSKLQIEGISFAYDAMLEDVFHNIDCTIEKGDGCILLVGENGSGKSTLLNIICGSLEPYDGIMTREDMSVAYLPFENPLFKHLTVLENLRYFYRNFRNCDFDIEDAFVKEVLTVLKIDYLNNRMDKCSSGQKQKAAIACILLSQADLIIMDEPFVAIDAKSTKGFISLLQKLKKDSVILLTTHTIEQLEAFADRLICLKDGNILVDTSSQEKIKEFFQEVDEQ